MRALIRRRFVILNTVGRIAPFAAGWIADFIGYLVEHGCTRAEATPDAQDEWGEHVNEVARGTMFTADSCNSWYNGANIEGKPRVFLPYLGGHGNYRKKCEDVAAAGYEGLVLTKAEVPETAGAK